MIGFQFSSHCFSSCRMSRMCALEHSQVHHRCSYDVLWYLPFSRSSPPTQLWKLLCVLMAIFRPWHFPIFRNFALDLSAHALGPSLRLTHIYVRSMTVTTRLLLCAINVYDKLTRLYLFFLSLSPLLFASENVTRFGRQKKRHQRATWSAMNLTTPSDEWLGVNRILRDGFWIGRFVLCGGFVSMETRAGKALIVPSLARKQNKRTDILH